MHFQDASPSAGVGDVGLVGDDASISGLLEIRSSSACTSVKPSLCPRTRTKSNLVYVAAV